MLNSLFIKCDRIKRVISSHLKSDDTKCAVSTDCWSSNSNLTYLGLTCHYIDQNFNLHNFVISFKHLIGSKTALLLHEEISKIFTTWNIKHKVIGITSDSGANIFSAISMFTNGNSKFLKRFFKNSLISWFLLFISISRSTIFFQNCLISRKFNPKK